MPMTAIPMSTEDPKTDAADLDNSQTGKMVSYRTQESDDQRLRQWSFSWSVFGKIGDPV